MTDWESIKKKYLNTDLSCRELADEFGVNRGTVSSRAARENWSELRRSRKEGDRESRLDRVREKLLKKMEETLDKTDSLDSKEIKTLTDALKEIKELQKQEESGEDMNGKKLEVCFVGETEALSR